MKNILGFDIGGTKCAVLLGRVSGQSVDFLGRSFFWTKDTSGADNAISVMLEEAEAILQNNGLTHKDIDAAGISCGGPLDSKRGVILSPPNLPGWDRIPIAERIESHFGAPVRIQNDANAGALAEWRFGAAQNANNAIFITFGTGCGAGLILDGRLSSGTNDMAGECGHIRLSAVGPVGYGKAGSMEGFCSGGGIAQLAGMVAREHLQSGRSTAYCEGLDSIEHIDVKKVAEAARKGDAAACKTFRLAGEYLGRGLSILVDCLNPEVIVLGGIFGRCHDLLVPPMEAVLKDEALERALSVCRIVPAQLGEAIGDYAAIAASGISDA